MRKQKDELDALKLKYNTDRLWSYSRINSYQTCAFSYYKKYVLGERDNADGVYLAFGNAIHDALEQYYTDQKPYEFISEAFEETKFKALTLAEMKFNNADDEKNDAIENKYLSCLEHFTTHHKRMADVVACEQFILTTLTHDKQNEYFIGYIDAMHYNKAEETLYITDYKTSTRYSGVAIKEHGNQLILNAIGVSQETKIPLNRIKARWNFLKYLTVSYVQKNGKIKETVTERNAWVKKMEVSLRTKLKELEVSELEKDIMILDAINANNLDNMPEEIRNAYTFDDAYVYVDLSLDNVKLVEEMLIDIINEIRENEKTEGDAHWVKEVDDKSSYYCSQLCGFRDGCPRYKAYLDNKMLFMDKPVEEKKDDADADWMKALGLG